MPVSRGPELLGWVRLTGQDHNWILAEFEPAAGFEAYRPLFDLERELSQRVDVAADVDVSAAEDEWHESLERINELGLSVSEPNTLVRDFKFTGAGTVEFKWGR